MKQKTELKAKFKKVVLTKDNLNQFVKLMNRRDVRGANVTALVKVLEAGDNFETPLMTNCKGSQERLIDGNHRIEAIELYLKRHPKRSVEAGIFYYEDLTVEEERKMYTQWNLGIKQTANDFIKQYWSVIPIVKKINNDSTFPCKINPKWTSTAMEFRRLVSGYLTKNDKVFMGGSRKGAMEFIETAKQLGDEDVNKMKAFLKEFIEVFGRPSKRNMHYKPPVFFSLFRIWLDNLSLRNYDEIQTAFHRLRGHPTVVYYTSFGSGREMVIQCRKELLTAINGKKQKGLFV